MAERYPNKITVNGKRIRRSHFLWNKRHPNDPVKPGEVVHHRDRNKKNDAPENHKKMTDAKHRSLHSPVGIKALRKWRKENRVLAKKQSCNNVKKLHKFMDKHPQVEKERRRKCRVQIIALNKARKGEKRPNKFKEGQREMMLRVWRKRKQIRKIKRR